MADQQRMLVTIEKIRPVISGLALVAGFLLGGLVRLAWPAYGEALVWVILPIVAVIILGLFFVGAGLLFFREPRIWGLYIILSVVLFVGGFAAFVGLLGDDWPRVR